jgi:hypothetical protein
MQANPDEEIERSDLSLDQSPTNNGTSNRFLSSLRSWLRSNTSLPNSTLLGCKGIPNPRQHHNRVLPSPSASERESPPFGFRTKYREHHLRAMFGILGYQQVADLRNHRPRHESKHDKTKIEEEMPTTRELEVIRAPPHAPCLPVGCFCSLAPSRSRRQSQTDNGTSVLPRPPFITIISSMALV